MLGAPLASCEAPIILFLLFAVLLLVLVLLGGVGVGRCVALPFLLLLFAVLPLFFLFCGARPYCSARTARHKGLEIITMHGKYYK